MYIQHQSQKYIEHCVFFHTHVSLSCFAMKALKVILEFLDDKIHESRIPSALNINLISSADSIKQKTGQFHLKIERIGTGLGEIE